MFTRTNPYTSRRTSTSMTDHALTMPKAKTAALDRTFFHFTVGICGGLPVRVIGKISRNSTDAVF